MDFGDDFLLMGHDGPFHLGIADGKPILRGLGLYHGKRGFGVSVEARVKLGPVTLLAMTQTADGQLKLLAAEAESIAGPTLQIGNTNSRIKFQGGMSRFVNQWSLQGPTHHCALGAISRAWLASWRLSERRTNSLSPSTRSFLAFSGLSTVKRWRTSDSRI